MLHFTEFLAISPEVAVTTASCLILLVGSFFKGKHATERLNFYVYTFGILCVILAACLVLNMVLFESFLQQKLLFRRTFVVDCAAVRIKFILLLCSVFCLVYIYDTIVKNKTLSIEFLSLFLFSLVGAMIVVSSNDFLVLYLGLELMSLPLYALIALNNNYKTSVEASFKYFVMGCVSSAILLFGISLLYGLSGSLNFTKVGVFLATNQTIFYHGIFIFCPAMIVTGLAFKFGAAPLHMWVPDVYKGAPVSVVLILGTLPKIAAYGMAYRFLLNIFKESYTLYMVVNMLALLALLSVFVGNLGALTQTHVKRLLGYSAISHIGFLLFGLLAAARGDFFVSSSYYLIVYVISFSGVLACLCSLSSGAGDSVELENITEFSGLFYRSPFVAFMLMLFLFSMIGIPPMAGFYAKFFVFVQLFYFGMGNIVVLLLLLSVVGSYYYLKIIREIFFGTYIKGTQDATKLLSVNTVNLSFFSKSLLVFSAFLIVFLGVFPEYLLNWCVLI